MAFSGYSPDARVAGPNPGLESAAPDDRPARVRGLLEHAPTAPAPGRAAAPATRVTGLDRTPSRTGKDTGIGRLPSHDFTINQAWLTPPKPARSCSPGSSTSLWTATSPKLSPGHCAAARLARRPAQTVEIPRELAWAAAITGAWQRISALPDTTAPTRPCELPDEHKGTCGTPRRPGRRHTPALKSRPHPRPPRAFTPRE